MKTTASVLSIAALLVTSAAHAQYYGSKQQGFGSSSNDQAVSGYTRSNGTYVEPYHRSSPDSTQRDNYSASGNTNPYTGQKGNRQPKW